jgi:hypothetical protein
MVKKILGKRYRGPTPPPSPAPSASSSASPPAAKRHRPERFRRPSFESWIATVTAGKTGPDYVGKTSTAAGSDHVTMTLGPTSLNYRSNDANPNLPTGIKKARETYPDCGFKAGHMLNCDLGGNGENSKNLTILTKNANTAMTKYDNALKNAVGFLKKLYETLHQAATDQTMLDEWAASGCGIKVTITAVGAWGVASPDCNIANKITIDAAVIKKDKVTAVTGYGTLPAQARTAIAAKLKTVEDEVGKANGEVPNAKPAPAAKPLFVKKATAARKKPIWK